ncbi:hypothetical protein chiPu_0024502 [Chiloscyllium punctatum]|uniref:Uncharacterized protein n=1 Tax=Chiloscyllium punctatum TaxID=137246 RepID=A0A401TE30_CHIPU|nr:hypothetical protein [Chiloscyllium punctatum]
MTPPKTGAILLPVRFRTAVPFTNAGVLQDASGPQDGAVIQARRGGGAEKRPDGLVSASWPKATVFPQGGGVSPKMAPLSSKMALSSKDGGGAPHDPWGGEIGVSSSSAHLVTRQRFSADLV